MSFSKLTSVIRKGKENQGVLWFHRKPWGPPWENGLGSGYRPDTDLSHVGGP